MQKAVQAAEPTPDNDEIMGTTEDDTAAQLEAESDAVVLDPTTSERQFHRDPLDGTRREIWRPGQSTPSFIATLSPSASLTA